MLDHTAGFRNAGFNAGNQLIDIAGKIVEALIAVLLADALAEITVHGCVDDGFHACMKVVRSEEHTSELQSLMRISYAVFCLKKTTNRQHNARYLDTHRSLQYIE